MSDLERLARALLPVEEEAKGLPWAAERRWRVQSHLWMEGTAPVIDLHDLSVRLAEEAVDRAVQVAPELHAGQLVFVVGVGRNSLGPPRLGRAVGAALDRRARPRGWRRAPGPRGRVLLILDEKRAPGRLGLGLGLGLLAFALLALVFVPPLGVVLLALLLLLAGLERR